MKTFILTTLFLLASSVALGDTITDVSLRRNLFETIGGVYEPWTIVTDQAAIDQDFHAIKEQLAMGTTTSLLKAERIYQEGAFSKSTAELTLDKPLDQPIAAKTEVYGAAYRGGVDNQVRGFVQTKANIGDTVLEVRYEVNSVQVNYVNCQVGANPDPHLNGCFAEFGSVHLPEMNLTLEYSYNVRTDNVNLRTIQGFSHTAREHLYDCTESCPKPEYEKYFNYYGHYYADNIISAAFQEEETTLLNGNHDFQAFSLVGKSEIIKVSIVAITMWMEVIYRMERALEHCYLQEDVNDELAVKYWDMAPAMYAGSLSLDGGNGNLLQDLADSRCMYTKTCGKNRDSTDEIAWVNYEVFKLFKTGQAYLLGTKCDEATLVKKRIVELMTIPLVQGIHRYGHVVANEFFDEKHVARAMVYSLAIVPLVNDCNPDDAAIIHDHATGNDVDFVAVRDALARNYQCLGVSCEEVGGLLDWTLDEYVDDMKPCVPDTSVAPGQHAEKEKSGDGLAIAGIVCFALTVVILAALKLTQGGRMKQGTNVRFEDNTSQPNLNNLNATTAAALDSIDLSDYVPRYIDKKKRNRDINVPDSPERTNPIV